MPYLYLIALLLLFSPKLMGQNPTLETPYEKSGELKTATYFETVAYYELLAKTYPKKLKLLEYGMTDAGYPLHVLVYDASGSFDIDKGRKEGKLILLINNGIHPGEPCGVDASMMLLRDLAQKSEHKNVIVASIALYNIGGSLNRGRDTRANQQGPENPGFRGNARNYDLNRDFIKQDTRNAQTFATIYAAFNPDVFVDTHTSNGADYQHVMTLLSTQPDKLGGELGKYLRSELNPMLYKKMAERDFPMTPYVDTNGPSPDDGILAFNDSPRYATGYGALYQTIGYTTEAHMLKTYKQRVEATEVFLEVLLGSVSKDASKIKKLRTLTIEEDKIRSRFPVRWEADTIRLDSIVFMGYTYGYKESKVTGEPRLYYDQSKPWVKNIPFFGYYNVAIEVTAPKAYVIPAAQYPIAERLKRAGVILKTIATDTLLTVEAYKFASYKTMKSPFEGHYAHYSVVLDTESQEVKLRKGDYLVYMNQPLNRFIVETLEPQAQDSYFGWNFFDTYIQQKEYYSPYVFEDYAAEMLASNEKLKADFEEKKANDSAFANNPTWQLDYLYQQSEYFEPEYLRYPIFRLTK